MSEPTTAPASERTEPLTGRQKAAIFCMAIGSELSSKITERLPPDDVEAISFEIARMDRVPAEATKAVLDEWAQTIQAIDSMAEGGVDYAREILDRSLGPARAAQIMKRIQGQLADVAGLDRLRNVDPQQLGNAIRGEHPQTIALILAHLEPLHTATIIREIEPGVGSDVIYRMARMEKVLPEMLHLIESTLGDEVSLSLTEGMRSSGGPAAVAAVLNLVNSSLEKELIDGLAAKDPELCEQVRNLMFVFEDIATLDNRALERLLREVEVRELALALKVASEDLKNRIMSAMTQRALGALKDEMDFLGPVRVRDVESAQAKIVALVRRLDEAGEIVVGSGGDDVVVV
jgi:flagellar motor switch protein FliG